MNESPESKTDSNPSTEDSNASSPSPSAEPSLESFVAQIKAEASAYADVIGETDKPTKLPGLEEPVRNRKSDRVARAERYARWRYQSWLEGKTSTL